MPVTIQKNKVKFKDPNNQGFISFNAFEGDTSAEFTELKNAIEKNFTINATLSSPLSIGGGWVDITLDKTNAEILAAAPLGRTVINIPFGDQTITCRQTSYTNNSVSFNGMMIDSAIYVFAVTIMQSTTQASLIGTMAGPQ